MFKKYFIKYNIDFLISSGELFEDCVLLFQLTFLFPRYITSTYIFRQQKRLLDIPITLVAKIVLLFAAECTEIQNLYSKTWSSAPVYMQYIQKNMN